MTICFFNCFLVLPRFELETKLQELERRRIDEEGRRAADTEKANDRVSAAQQSKDQAERELIGVK